MLCCQSNGPQGVRKVYFCLKFKKENENGEGKEISRIDSSMEEDFAQWYTDVVKKAELIAYTSVKGCMAIKPAGYAIWENIAA